MEIPRKINIAGMVLETIIDTEMTEKHGLVGQIDHNMSTIRLDPSMVSRQVVEQTYVHEVVHGILNVMGRDDLRDDDTFVDLLSHLIYQVIETREGVALEA